MNTPNRTALIALNSEVFRSEDAYIAELADIFQRVADKLRVLAKEEPFARVCTRLLNEVNEITPKNIDRELAFLRFRAIAKE